MRSNIDVTHWAVRPKLPMSTTFTFCTGAFIYGHFSGIWCLSTFSLSNLSFWSCSVTSDDIPWRFQPWLWPLGQQGKTATKHSGCWWCTIIVYHYIWLQKAENFRRYGTNSYVLRISACTVTFTLKIVRNPNFLHDTPGHDDTSAYQVSLRKVKWFRRCCQDN